MTTIDHAIASAIAFLSNRQLPSGEIPVMAHADPDMHGDGQLDPSIYPTALAARALSFAPEGAAICARAVDFLASEMDRDGLWKHWTRAHPQAASLPPDLDDTSCAALALTAAGRPVPDNRELLLANRSRTGRFFTWLAPRPRLTGPAHMRRTLPMLRRIPTLLMFFLQTSAKPYDVDAVVNANVLRYLGAFPGRDSIEDWLVDILRAGAERQCDKWYDNPFVVRYFLSGALAGNRDRRDLLVARTLAEPAETSLDQALGATTLIACGADPRALIDRLLAEQCVDGSWPRAAVYHGGRPRLRGGSFGPKHPDTPHWGSDELTTVFAVEALARAR